MNMPVLREVIDASTATRAPCDDDLVLPFAARQKTRQRVRLASGRTAGVHLPRGSILRGGVLLAGDGLLVRVVAAPETVSVVTGSSAELLRAAYHLGNRHVALELGECWVAYLHDHVLDDMVRGLGLAVSSSCQPFEPEAGAYAAGPHTHAAGHDHGHDHVHDHGNHPRHAHDARG